MKLALLSAIAIQLLAVSSSASAAADDAVSPMIPDPNLLEGTDVAYPPVLANIADKELSSSFADQTGLPDYCYDDRDYDCYRKGIPKCCIRSRLTCPYDKPRCRNRKTPRNTIPAGEYCNYRRRDICASGYKCTDGICQRRVSGTTIARGGICRVGVDICVRGTSCISGRCSIPVIPAGEYCNYRRRDVCERGYFCDNGRCAARSRVIRRGGVCLPGDICENGYTCTDGRCVIPVIPAGGICYDGDVCVNGSTCLNGICSAGMWYTNWQYCVMSCPTSAGSCCGGNAQSWNQVYSSAEDCCGQSAFNGNHDGCLNRSLQCIRQNDWEMKQIE